MYNHDPKVRKKSQHMLQSMFPRTEEGFAKLIHSMLYFQYVPLYIYHMKTSTNHLMPPHIQREYQYPQGVENEIIDEYVRTASNECGAKSRSLKTNSYHAKVLRLEDAEQLVSLDEDLDLGTLPKNIMPYEVARDLIIDAPDKIAVIDCICRMANGNDGCFPRDVCLLIGDPWVTWALDRDRFLNGRLITKDEALKILRECHERGNVHAAFFKDVAAGRVYSICNCCPCCCTALQAQNYLKVPMMAGSGYIAKIDEDKCKKCGQCAKKCNFLAIKMEDGKPVVNPDLCKGCEGCLTFCKFGAITMEPGDFSVMAPMDIEVLKAQKAEQEAAAAAEASEEK